MVTVTTSLASCSPWLPADSGSGGNGLTLPAMAGAARVQGRVHAVRCGSPQMRNRREIARSGCGWM